MANKFYGVFNALTGGAAGALDSQDGSVLADGDIAFAVTGGIFYIYLLDADSGAAESSPDVIPPDDNAGNKRWILQAMRPASTTIAGIVELATSAETIAGTDTARANTPAGSAAAMAVIKNPLAFSQGIHMTAAASGSNGIQVADDDDIDFGTGNFTMVWRGSLPDWTPSALQRLLFKYASDYGYFLFVNTNGTIAVKLHRNSGTGTEFTSTAATGFIDGTEHEIAAVITRETVSAAGSVVFYVDGLPIGSSVAITAAATVTISNTSNLYVLGNNVLRTAGIVHSTITYNRALTAAEVLSLYRNGIDFADKYGSQTSIITGNDSTFAGASNWANVDVNAYDETGDLTITANAIGQYCTLPVANATMVSGKKYRLVYDVANLVSTWTIKDFSGTQTIDTIDADGTGQSVEFTASTTGGLRIVSVAVDSSADIDNVYLYEIGATFALEPEGIQPAPGQWLDSGINKLHALQPAAGSSLIRPKKSFEFRWTNTWTASSAAQYIGGLNQAVLSSDHFITEIISKATVTTSIQDITIGDGSDADRFVASVTPTAAAIYHTIANRENDGTNLKLVVTPAGSATMTIEFIVRGFLLEP